MPPIPGMYVSSLLVAALFFRPAESTFAACPVVAAPDFCLVVPCFSRGGSIPCRVLAWRLRAVIEFSRGGSTSCCALARRFHTRVAHHGPAWGSRADSRLSHSCRPAYAFRGPRLFALCLASRCGLPSSAARVAPPFARPRWGARPPVLCGLSLWFVALCGPRSPVPLPSLAVSCHALQPLSSHPLRPFAVACHSLGLALPPVVILIRRPRRPFATSCCPPCRLRRPLAVRPAAPLRPSLPGLLPSGAWRAARHAASAFRGSSSGGPACRSGVAVLPKAFSQVNADSNGKCRALFRVPGWKRPRDPNAY